MGFDVNSLKQEIINEYMSTPLEPRGKLSSKFNLDFSNINIWGVAKYSLAQLNALLLGIKEQKRFLFSFANRNQELHERTLQAELRQDEQLKIYKAALNKRNSINKDENPEEYALADKAVNDSFLQWEIYADLAGYARSYENKTSFYGIG